MAGQITHSNFRQAVFGDGDLQALIFYFQHHVVDVFTFDLPGFTLNDLRRTVLRVNYEFTKGQTHVRWAPFVRQDLTSCYELKDKWTQLSQTVWFSYSNSGVFARQRQ